MTPFRKALFIYAARYTNPDFVALLVQKVDPNASISVSKKLPPGFGSVADNLVHRDRIHRGRERQPRRSCSNRAGRVIAV